MLLALLAEEPMHGYQMIQEIGRRSGGAWRPSPGSVYPTLQQLEDEGLVRADEHDGRRVYRLTEDGQHHVADRTEEFADLWDGMAPRRDESSTEMGDLVFGVAAAFLHVMRTGSSAPVERARAVLARTRSDLYRILGDDVSDENGDDAADADADADTDADDGTTNTEEE
jgi:DNA-binding PadR family transcriptional regulator